MTFARWHHARVWAAIAVLVVLVLGERVARAFVRFSSAQGTPLFWSTSCIPVGAYPDDLMDLTPDQTMHAVQAAAAAWSHADNACTYLAIDVQREAGPAPATGFDGRNLVVFRKDAWCAPSADTGACTGGHDPAQLALTTIFMRTSGEIADVDIEVNAVDFAWTDLDINPTLTSDQDLQNELTRQFGHAVGLEVPCYIAGAQLDASGHPLDPFGRPLVDNLGQPVPDCNAAPAAVLASAMFPSRTAGDTSRRTLSADDVQGLCAIYPLAADPGFCPLVDVDGGRDGSPPDAPATDATPLADAGTIDSGSDHGALTADATAADDARANGAHTTPAGGCGCDVGAGATGAQWVGVGLGLPVLARIRCRRRRRSAGR